MTETTTWDRYAGDGENAMLQGNYREAEACWYTAMKVAEYFGERDPRLSQSIEKLATVYTAMDRKSEADKLNKRANQIRARITGVNLQPPPNHNPVLS
jgi:hypothetical protein